MGEMLRQILASTLNDRLIVGRKLLHSVVLQAYIDLPVKVIFGVDSSARLGMELAAMGVYNVGIVAGARTSDSVESLLQSLEAAGRKVTGVFKCDRLEPSEIDSAVATLSGSDAVVSIGGWLQTSLSMYACCDLQALHVAVAAPPGLSTTLARAPVPLKGFSSPRQRFTRPSLVIFDPTLVSILDRNEVVAEVAALCGKAIGLGRINYLANVLARSALEEFKRAIAREDLERLCFSVAISSLANRLLPSSATLALARALHALHGIDPFLAELAIFPSWLRRFFERFHAIGDLSEALDQLRQIQSLLECLSLPTLKQLGLKAKMLDLVAEYAWTYEHHSIESDPVALDKYSLRGLLNEAMRR